MELKGLYKHKVFGSLPVGWNEALLGTLAEVSSGTTPARVMKDRYYRNGVTMWVKTMDLSNADILTTSEKITLFALNDTGIKIYKPGSVLVAMYGGFQQIGRTGLLRVPAAVNQAISAIQLQPNTLVSEYLLATLNYKVGYWKNVASSSRKDPNITSKDIRDFSIAYPSVAEQQAIASVLRDADKLLGTLETLLAKRRDIKQAATQQFLTGRKRLPGFYGEWKTTQLKEIGLFLKGSGITKDQAQSGSLPCVRYGELYTRHSNVIRNFYSWISPAVALHGTRLRNGDILFAGSGETKEEIGKCAAFVSKVEAYAGGDIVILRPRNNDSTFLGYYLNTTAINGQKASCGQGDAVVHIASSALGKIVCTLPPLSEQTAIAAVLSDMDAEIAALEARRDKTRLLKQGMMQELLTGRIRLTPPGPVAQTDTRTDHGSPS